MKKSEWAAYKLSTHFLFIWSCNIQSKTINKSCTYISKCSKQANKT